MIDLEKKAAVQFSKDIFPSEAWDMISADRKEDIPVILDVSTPQEYRNLHLEGAVNVNLFSRHFKTRLETLDREKAVVVYCKLGGRSKIAQKRMQGWGFRKIYNIIGGALLWKEEELPFAPGADRTNQLLFCPFAIGIFTFKKIRKALGILRSRVFQRKEITVSAGQESNH